MKDDFDQLYSLINKEISIDLNNLDDNEYIGNNAVAKSKVNDTEIIILGKSLYNIYLIKNNNNVRLHDKCITSGYKKAFVDNYIYQILGLIRMII